MRNRNAKPTQRAPDKCPKCSGKMIHGGIRFGVPVNDISTCVSCGLTTESETFIDCQLNVRRPVRTP
jgi:hypothetical protein